VIRNQVDQLTSQEKNSLRHSSKKFSSGTHFRVIPVQASKKNSLSFSQISQPTDKKTVEKSRKHSNQSKTVENRRKQSKQAKLRHKIHDSTRHTIFTQNGKLNSSKFFKQSEKTCSAYSHSSSKRHSYSELGTSASTPQYPAYP